MRTQIQGNNRYCAPAVIAVLAGLTTDEAAIEINKLRSKPANTAVTGVYESETKEVLRRLGFKVIELIKAPSKVGSLFNLLSTRPFNDGRYMITLPGHVVLVEVLEGKKYFLDNQTGCRIPAASAVKMMMRVHSVTKIER